MGVQYRQRLYHCSRRRLRVGDALWKAPGSMFCIPAVFLTTSPVPHRTIAERVLAAPPGRYHVYEVEAYGRLIRGTWDDVAAVDGADVLRYVGNARGILLNHLRRHGITPKTQPAYFASLNDPCPTLHLDLWHARGSDVRRDTRLRAGKLIR